MRSFKRSLAPLLMVLMHTLLQTLILNVVVLHPRERSLAFGNEVVRNKRSFHLDRRSMNDAIILRQLENDDESQKDRQKNFKSHASKSSKHSKSSKQKDSKSLSDKSSKKSKNTSEKSSKSFKDSKNVSVKSSKSSKKGKSIPEKSSKNSNSVSLKSSKSLAENSSKKSNKNLKSKDFTTSLSDMAHHAKMDHQQEGVKEKDPLVKDSDKKSPSLLYSTPFQVGLATVVLGLSLLVQFFKMRKTTRPTAHDSGGAYKPVAMDGGAAEMTKIESKNDLNAEYGESEDLGSPESFRALAQ